MYKVENSLLMQVESINSINHGKKRYKSFDKKKVVSFPCRILPHKPAIDLREQIEIFLYILY